MEAFMSASKSSVPVDQHEADVVIVGAGFGGLYSIYKLRELGFRVQAFEAAPSVGGTWFWNRYPGARCDVESLQYSFSFSEELQVEWRWTERYAAQSEILRYLEHVADRFNLRPHIQLGTRVKSAHFNEATGRWNIETDDGKRWSAAYCVMATGPLSQPQLPDIPGIDTFAGQSFHTSRWPEQEVDFTGKRVGVIGTGSTGIQLIPALAERASQVVVFQRTPNYVVPAVNRPLKEDELKFWRRHYPQIRHDERISRTGVWDPLRGARSAMEFNEAEREYLYRAAWDRGGFGFQATFADLLTNMEANQTAADFVRARIREAVKNPETAESLCPKDYPFAAKRLCVYSGYYETFNKPNVRLVDLRRDPIKTVTPQGVTTEGSEIPLDVLVFATGFDALTGALKSIDIRGRNGKSLRALWSDGPVSYLGLCVAGFPNLFMLAGPGSPAALSNAVVTLEHHVDFVATCLKDLRGIGMTHIEATEEAQHRWCDEVRALADQTLMTRAKSWYNRPPQEGKPRIFVPFVGGVGVYRDRCNKIIASGYEGFDIYENGVEAMRAAA